MSSQTSSRSLPWPPSSNKADSTSCHHQEQGQAVSATRLELPSGSCCLSHSTSRGRPAESVLTPSEASGVDAIEAVVRGLRSSDRLFCEPLAGTSSIVEAAAAAGRRPAPLMLFEGSVAVAVDTEDPYWDFRASMEEMVAAHGDADDWGWLEGMLEWYLRANGQGSHGIIVEAFVDLLLALASSPPLLFASASTSTSSSSCSRPKKKKMTKKKTTTT